MDEEGTILRALAIAIPAGLTLWALIIWLIISI